MKCPSCGADEDKVLDTRSSGDGTKRRRRVCLMGHRFSTTEMPSKKLKELESSVLDKIITKLEDMKKDKDS